MASTADTKEDQSWSMKTVIASMKMKWPNVNNMSTVDLHNRLQAATQATPQAESATTDSRHGDVLLLDTRPTGEYEVSHLDGAIRVDPDCNDIVETSRLIKEKRASTVVCYCSLGYRSSKYAAQLYKHFKSNPSEEKPKFYNLEGSIFKWANEGRPMVDMQGVPTVFCHPYSAVWGRVLNSDLRKWSNL